ncbi:hypothetical protein A3K73_06940 [Candidatus Pacearchaeota archaeon RBG_13_36_9]|nr:MAG: hypothetical protein A3K73_06940 [Candidatus Pacearchaeota archaeon RBG_13_36_9]
MDEIKIKEAFLKIKEEMFGLGSKLSEIRREMQETARLVRQMDEELTKIKIDIMLREAEKPSNLPTDRQTVRQAGTPTNSPTDQSRNTTDSVIPTHNPTHGQEIGGWNTQNFPISIGNEGVPTDRQTDRQTVQQTHFLPEIPPLVSTKSLPAPRVPSNVVTNKTEENPLENTPIFSQKLPRDSRPIKQQISDASEILASLDNIKREIRRKFKSITKQEMLVFSTIYTLEEQDPDPDYQKIASKLRLSESSIRDYVQRIAKKGIPIEKEKLNNKKIILHISPELKKIATLDTIIKLRSL